MTFSMYGTQDNVNLEASGPATLKSVAFIPALDPDDESEIALAFQIGQLSDDDGYLSGTALWRDAGGTIVGKFDFIENINSSHRCIVSKSSEGFPRAAALDIVANAS